MKKDTMISLLLCVLISMALFANGGNEDTDSAEEITIRVQTRWASDAPHERAFQELLMQFDEMRDDVIVVDESIGDEQAFNDKLKTAIATGNTPDLVYTLGGESFKEYAKNKVYADLAPEFAKDPDWKNFFLPLFDTWTYDDVQGVYGVPFEIYGIVLFYNKALFDEYSLTPPQTLEEFEEVADQFMAKGILPMALSDRGVWRGGHLFTNLIMKKFGFEKVKALAERKAKYTDPDIVEIFELMDSWNQKGYFGENITGFDYNEEKALFHNKKSAMHMDGSWYISSAAESPILDNIGVVRFPYYASKPQFKNHWMGGSSGGLSISGSLEGKKYQAVVDLLKFLTSAESFGYIQSVVGGGVYPVKMEVDPAQVNQLTVDYSAILATAEDMKVDSTDYDPLPQMTDRLRNSIQGMFAGSMTPKQTAEEIQAEIDMSM